MTRGAILAGAVSCVLLAACATPPAAGGWLDAFDGRSLGAFAVTDFGGQGPVDVAGGCVQLGMGSPLTGITWTGEPPRGEYELEVVAARVLGSDFFCGLTFPVGDRWLTLVLGGWGGSVCGLSSLDGHDAARNATRTLRPFTPGVEHRVRVLVTAARVAAELDGELLAAIDPRAHDLGLRPEMLPSRPLGIASFATVARVRVVRWRPWSGGGGPTAR